MSLVTDLRLLPPDGDGDGDGESELYSDIEFVTGPKSLVGGQAKSGPGLVTQQLAEVRRIRDALYKAGPAALDGAAPALSAG